MTITTLHGDCREVLQTLPAGSVQCVVTSPPYYGLRRYSDDPREIGQEATPALYVAALVEVFRQVRRVLRDDGCVWLNIGDSYDRGDRVKWSGDAQRGTNAHKVVTAAGGYGSTPAILADKQLLGIPWRVAFALQDDGWILRSDCIWHKPNCMPESVTDRPTRAHEYVFLLSKSPRYYFDATAIAEPLANAPVTSIVNGSDLGNEITDLGQDIRLQEAASKHALSPSGHPGDWRIFKICVRLATAILDLAKLQQEVSMAALDTQIGQQGMGDDNSLFIRHSPDGSTASIFAARFLNADTTAEMFLEQLNGLGVTLPYGDDLRKARSTIELLDAPSIDSDRDAAIRVNDASQVSQLQIVFGDHDDAPVVDNSYDVVYHNGTTSSKNTSSQTRNKRTVWEIPTQPFKGSHYATMPEALIEPCILAGSSAQACEHCGAAWGRVVERDKGDTEAHERPKRTAGMESKTSTLSLSGNGSKEWAERGSKVRDLGFAPRCACPDNTGSARSVVLDPFGGSGTVGKVAMRYQRDAVLIELNQAYIDDHIETRTDGVQVELFV